MSRKTNISANIIIEHFSRSSRQCNKAGKGNKKLNNLEGKTKLLFTNTYVENSISSVQLFHCVQLFATPWTAVCQASLSITNSQSRLKLMSIKSVMPSNHLFLCCPLLFPPSSFPASGSFPIHTLKNTYSSSHQVAKVWIFMTDFL